MAGDCPTFFTLPKLFPGTERYLDAHGPLPNHVHKSGGSGGDQFQVGTWTDGKPGSEADGGTPGTWEILAGTGTVFQDKGKTHASKVSTLPLPDVSSHLSLVLTSCVGDRCLGLLRSRQRAPHPLGLGHRPERYPDHPS